MTLISELRAALPKDAVLTEPAELRTYECDGLTGWRAIPQAVVLPVRPGGGIGGAGCAAHAVPFVARGAGTGLAGGAMPSAEGIVIGLARMNRILDVDVPNRRARVQPGVTNLEVSRAVAPARSLLRARSFQPAGVHDRRQRRRELRRRALPQVRLHHQPRARAGGGAGRRQRGHGWSETGRSTWWRGSWAPRARSGS